MKNNEKHVPIPFKGDPWENNSIRKAETTLDNRESVVRQLSMSAS
tara:strand:- start:57 stop:191 length:135 start_codon:yes stop_codon:yes gene_type:complete